MKNKLITCKLSVLLVLILLFGLLSPVTALAADGLELQNSNSTQDLSSDVLNSVDKNPANVATDAGTEEKETLDSTLNNSQLDEDTAKETTDAQNSSSNPPTVESAPGNTTVNDNKENLKDPSSDNVKAEEKEKAITEGSDGTSSGGSISSADGSGESDHSSGDNSTDLTGASSSGVLDLYVSAEGNDESGDGSKDRPFATINAALEASGDSSLPVELCLLTDLVITRPVRVLGNTVLLTGNNTVVTITRSADFSPEGTNSLEEQFASNDVASDDSNPNAEAVDERESVTAMFAVGDPDEDQNAGGELILANLIINEKGLQGEPLQDAVISLYDGARLILGDRVWLQNYGGSSAVHARQFSEVTVSAGTWIYDTQYFAEDGSKAIWAEENSNVIIDPASIVLSHGEEFPLPVDAQLGESYDLQSSSGSNDELASQNENQEDDEQSDQQNEETQQEDQANTLRLRAPKSSVTLQAASSSPITTTFSLSGPDSIAKDDALEYRDTYQSSIQGYVVPYEITLKLSDLVPIGADKISSVKLSVEVTLDELLYPEAKNIGSSEVIVSHQYEENLVSATYDSSSHVLKIDVESGSDIQLSVDELAKEHTLSFDTILLFSNYQQGKSLESTAEVKDSQIALQGEDVPLPITAEAQNKETKLLGNRNTILKYDPTTGTGGPGEEKLPPENGHLLNTENVPTHEADNGVPVLFYGWTSNRDEKIYAAGDEPPVTITQVDLKEGETTEVFAVYARDENHDGTSDIDETVTLFFDANGGSGAPDPITEVKRRIPIGNIFSIGASIDIPEQEPTLYGYTFLGWSEEKKDKDTTTEDDVQYKYAEKGAENDILIREDTTLYAVWQKNYTLYFNGNGGTNVPPPQPAESQNDNVATLTITTQIPTRVNYTFLGWSTSRHGKASFKPGEKVLITNGDVTLYAVWQRNGSWYSRVAPKTGDDSNVLLYALLAAGSVAAITGIAVYMKKRKR